MTSVVPELPLAMRTDFNVFLEKAHSVLNPDAPFLSNWHIERLAWDCRRFADGLTKRLIICMPPRHLKSTIGSVALPAWILGRNPAAKIICASYGEDLAKDFSDQTRRLINSESYARAFPHVKLEKSTDMHLRTLQGGERYATTVGGAITGKGADFIIVDDPTKYQDVGSEARRDDVANWTFNLPTRLNYPNSGGILVIAQRLHEDDVIGRIIDKGGWEPVILPLIAMQDEQHEIGSNRIYARKAGELLHPARIDRERANQLLLEIGKDAFDAQYQQRPLPANSGSFDLGMFKRFTVPPEAFEHIFFSVDVASIANGGDYSVCTIWGYVEQRFYLLDLWRKQVSFPELRKTLLGLDKKWAPSLIIVEAVGSGQALYQDLYQTLGSYVTRCRPVGSKVHRFETVIPLINNGQVLIPTSSPWLETLIKELQAFPQGKHDDQVDSISQMLFDWRRAIQLTRHRCNPRARRQIPTNYKNVATLKVKLSNIQPRTRSSIIRALDYRHVL
jgi:predicted phage terminase large subunit-like protein